MCVFLNTKHSLPVCVFCASSSSLSFAAYSVFSNIHMCVGWSDPAFVEPIFCSFILLPRGFNHRARPLQRFSPATELINEGFCGFPCLCCFWFSLLGGRGSRNPYKNNGNSSFSGKRHTRVKKERRKCSETVKQIAKQR